MASHPDLNSIPTLIMPQLVPLEVTLCHLNLWELNQLAIRLKLHTLLLILNNSTLIPCSSNHLHPIQTCRSQHHQVVFNNLLINNNHLGNTITNLIESEIQFL